jgi:amidohydrolase
MRDLSPLIAEALPALTALRHEIHQHPERSFHEHATAERVAQRLATLPGMSVRTGLATTGVVATLDAGKSGPCVALRADMDALPLAEATGLPYASRVTGTAHACGHDGHVACLVGAAQVLSAIRDELRGPVLFIFQPAEENGGGGRLLCDAGVLDTPPAAAIFALHAWPALPVGTIGVCPGPAMAATDTVEIAISGAGTHAAAPHRGVDPILVAAHMVTALQSVVSRTLDPVQPAVLTIAQIEAGTTHNVIPDRAVLRGTLRTLTADARAQAAAAISRIAEHTAQAFGAHADARIIPGYPVLVNEARAAAHVLQVGRDTLGPDAAQTLPASLGGEDFAYYLQRVPGAIWRLGVRAPKAVDVVPLHSPRFDFADAAIPVGVRLHCEIVRRYGADAGMAGKVIGQ